MLGACGKENMIKVLKKSEAIEKMLEGNGVYTTCDFKEYVPIKEVQGYVLKDGQYASGKQLFFATQTKEGDFKTVNNAHLKMERVTWEKLRDVYLDYIKGLPIGNKRFLLEDEPLAYSTVWGKEEFDSISYVMLSEHKNTNIYMFKIKEVK